MNEQPLMEFTSHVAGRNAKVAIYSDRIEWTRVGLTEALRTSGLPLPGRRDTNMIPIRQIQGVSTHKAGLSYTTVRVATAGDATEFRITKRQAQDVRATLLHLMNQPAPAAGASSDIPRSSVADELRKLGELRDSGLLTEEEFAEQKSRLLGK